MVVHPWRWDFCYPGLFSAEEIDDALLKELIGHEPIEVFGGAILGSLVAVASYYVMYHG